ncbi:MAG: rhodanese-like domain-containing protein [Pseudomonadota bacterium]
MVAVKQIDVETLHEWRRQGQPHVLLDIREDAELAQAHISKAVHIPFEQLIKKLDLLDLELPIVVLCHHGIRSVSACIFLSELGAKDVLNLSGGIDAWARRIDTTVGLY